MEKPEKLDRDYILNFLENHGMAVLSSVNKMGWPDATPIYFIIKDNFDIFFITSTQTQKYINLNLQKHIMLTVVDEETKETAQITGVVDEEKELLNEIFSLLEERLFKENPKPIIPLMENNGQKTVFKIIVGEINMKRYTKAGLEETKINMNNTTTN